MEKNSKNRFVREKGEVLNCFNWIFNQISLFVMFQRKNDCMGEINNEVEDSVFLLLKFLK